MINPRDAPPAEIAEKAINRMNLLFWGSMALQFVAAVAIFVGLVARGYKHLWGIWFTIAGWTTFASGYVIRAWVRRWFYKRRDEYRTCSSSRRLGANSE